MNFEEFDYKDLKVYKKNGPCYFYIIKYLTKNNKIFHYKGITHNIQRRVEEHREEGKRFANIQNKVFWVTLFKNKSDAMTFEYWSKNKRGGPYIKKYYTEEKKNFILCLLKIKKIIKKMDYIIYKNKRSLSASCGNSSILDFTDI